MDANQKADKGLPPRERATSSIAGSMPRRAAVVGMMTYGIETSVRMSAAAQKPDMAGNSASHA